LALQLDDQPAPRARDAFDDLRDRLPESVAIALRDRWDRQANGKISLHLRKGRHELLDAWLRPDEPITVRKLDRPSRAGAK
jgi:hypothetical protein